MRVRLLSSLALLFLITMIGSMSVHAEPPYHTSFFAKKEKNWSPIQPVYSPGKAVVAGLIEPVDIRIDANDHVYIADKSANRVVVLDRAGNVLQRIGNADGIGALNAPTGISITPEHDIYIADSGNQRIAVFSKEGIFKKEYKKPNASILEKEFFVPLKLTVDRRGVMYILLNASNQGMLRMNPTGEFGGYFGTNKAQQSTLTWLKKLILNKEQLAKEAANLPLPITNITSDSDGFLYTATAGLWGQGAIRKLNAGGVDQYKNLKVQNAQGIVGIAIDKSRFMYGIDTERGKVTIYDPEAGALFSFGRIDPETQQQGVLGFPTGIAVDSQNTIWITDSRTKTIARFERTKFGNDVLTGQALYMEGRYEESKPYWESVNDRNDMFDGVDLALGKVALHEKQYADALRLLKSAYDTKGYSQAFWEVRLVWLQTHLVWSIFLLVAGIILVQFGGKWIKKKLGSRSLSPWWTQYSQDLRSLVFILLHPYQGFYRLKEHRVSLISISTILILAIGMKILSIYKTGFLFNDVDLAQINLYRSLLFFVVPWVTWLIANYLVCSIRNGEGLWREVIQAGTYVFSPYILFSIPIVLLSNVVTLEERVLVDSLQTLMWIWVGVMLFVSTQVIHNYEFTETLKNTVITSCTVVLIWFFGFIIFGLSSNFLDFIQQLYQEAIFNG